MFVEVLDLCACQKCAGILPRGIVRSHHPDGLISLLEFVRSADQLLIKGLIETAFYSTDVCKYVLIWLDLVDRYGCSAGCGASHSSIICQGGTGSSHDDEKISPGNPFVSRPLVIHAYLLLAERRASQRALGSRNAHRDVDDPILLPPAKAEPASLEYLQHWDVIRENLGDQFLEPGLAGQRNDVAHQHCADALSLVFIDNRERYLGCPRTHDDVTSATDDCPPAAFSDHDDDCNVVGEIDIHEEVDFLFGKMALQPQETAVKRSGADAVGGCDKISAVAGSEGADFDSASVAQSFDYRIVGRFRH